MNPNSHKVNTVERACTDLVQDGDGGHIHRHRHSHRPQPLHPLPEQELRAVIEHHKHKTDEAMTAITDEIATLRAAVSTLAERVRNHEEQLRRIRT